jgi:predicted porin
MSRNVTKTKLLLASSVVALATVALPAVARADSLAQLTAELNQLQAQVAQLKAQQAAQEQAQAVAAAATAAPPAHGPALVTFGGAALPPGARRPIVGGVPLAVNKGGAIYLAGTIDGGLRLDSGAGHSILSAQSGAMRASRLALEGYENIGYGLLAVGVLEGGLNIEQGLGASNPSSAGTAFDFGRESYVGIGNDKMGYLDFGRQYSPEWAAVASPTADPFGGNYLGGIVAVSPTLAVNSRVSNAIIYNYGYTWEGMIDPAPRTGLGFAAMYAPSGNNGTAAAPTYSGQQEGAMVSYGTKTWFLDVGYNQIDGIQTANGQAPYAATYIPAVTNKTALKEYSAAGSYLTPYARLFAQYDLQTDGRKNAGAPGTALRPGQLGVDQYDFFVGAVIPTLPHENLRFIVGKTYNKTTDKAQYTVEQASYEYDLVTVPGTAIYLEGSLVQNSAHSAQGIIGASDAAATNNSVLPTQLTKNGTTPDYGATASTVATGVRFIF